MPAPETPRHLELKRLALIWAQRQGFRVAGAEVSLPQLRVRLDAAACRPPRRTKASSLAAASSSGPTMIFECKQQRADFLRDSRCTAKLDARLRHLHEQRSLYESSMQVHLPSLRNGDTLFPEFDGYRYEAAGFEPYESISAEIRRLTNRLHRETKFANLLRWRAANLFYVVAEEGVAYPHELPAGWGLLLRSDCDLVLAAPAVWQEIPQENGLQLLLKLAMSGTRATNRAFGIAPAELQLSMMSRLAPPSSCMEQANA